MRNWKLSIQIIFWAVLLLVWILWIRERIAIFDYFIDQYKNIGYIVDTNNQQTNWYILISIFKAAYLFLISYYILPKIGFSKVAVYKTIAWFVPFVSLEYLTALSYYHLISNFDSSAIRIEWAYEFWPVTLIYLLTAIFGWTFSSAFHWITEYQVLKQFYKERKSLENLNAQLNPHFLFNTINVFYAIAIDQENNKLQRSILNLTETLRYSIDYGHAEEVNLSKEVEAIQSFIELQKERFHSDAIGISTAFSLENKQIKIVPLILMNYVENAFSHGYHSVLPSEIKLSLVEKKGLVELKIENTNHAKRNKEDGGNKTTEKILKLKYSGKHKLSILKTDNLYELCLRLQLK